MLNSKRIFIDNTNFKYKTNFSGDASRDKYGDDRRKANILIPSVDQAKDLIKMGIRVKETKPGRNDDPNNFTPEYYVKALLKYRKKDGDPVKYPPKVYLIEEEGREPILLNEDTVENLDGIWVKNVNVVLEAYDYDPMDKTKKSLKILTMYVEQDTTNDPYVDPYAERYSSRHDDDEEEDEVF